MPSVTFNCSATQEGEVPCVFNQGTVPAPPGDGIQLTKKPNIVLIQFDDLGFGDWQYNGFGVARTPVINRISNEGVSVDRYHVASPICSPSRYSMVTGLNPAEDGIFNTILNNPVDNLDYNNIDGIPTGTPTIYDELKNQCGYANAHYGKWHMGDADQLTNGVIDDFGGWNFPGTAIVGDWADLLTNQGELIYRQTRDDLVGDKTCDFINQHAGTTPFFISACFAAPHYPLFATPAGMAAVSHLAENATRDTLDPANDRQSPAQLYYAAIWEADRVIGEIYDCLDAAGVLDNTILIITSDNGPLTEKNPRASADQWGRTGVFRGRKNQITNGGLRVPFLIRGPSIPDEVVLQNTTLWGGDLMPTLLHMVGANVPSVDGEIMTAQLQGQDVDRTTPIHFITIRNPNRSQDGGDRSQTLRGYYPVGTVGNNIPLNVLSNEPGNAWGDWKSIYFNEDDAELENVDIGLRVLGVCQSLRDSAFGELYGWFNSLPGPRMMNNAGRLEHRT